MAFAMLMNGEVRGGEAPLPDLTKGTSGIDRSLTYNLGATGMRGWIYTPHWPQNIAGMDAMQGRTTGSSRQILVTHVGDKSPADGVMKVDDVILGIDDQPFIDDARKSLAKAIQEAEKEPVEEMGSKTNESMKKTRSGHLALLRWRAGKTETVELKMRVLGTYSDTAPYHCPKSAKILEEACAALQKESGMWPEISGLAMLATGDPRFLPQIKVIAQAAGPSTLKYDMSKIGMGVWQMGYQGIFLCEYYLLTGDKSVEHAIHEITVTLAKGQSMYGTLGHGISDLTAEGKFHGSIPPYGPVNQCGLTANLAIILGKRCGVKDPEVEAAVARANGFFGYYVDKGTIPYGEHEPWYYHENNGKSAMCAALFGVQADRIKETQYFTKMCVAAYPNTETGHTGQGFGYLWRMVGANMGGPLAASAFFKEMSWHFDMARRCDGTFTYDGQEQYGPGKTDDNTYYGKSSYYDVSPNACHVLSYAAPLRNLCITGKDMKPVTVGQETKAPAWLTRQEVADAIAAGRFDLERKRMSPQELTTALGNWSPIVRLWAAEELAKRPETQALVPQLITAAEGPDARLRLGACETLHQLKASQALPVFVRLLYHEDRGLRFLAARAIKDLGVAAQPALNDTLKAFVDTAEPLVPVNFADPIQFAHGQLIPALFAGGLTDALKQADPKLVLKAARVASRNADNRARGCLEGFINQLTADEVKTLLPDIVELATSHGPADTMFSREIRVSAFKVLAKYHFQEGIRAAPLVAKGKYGCHNAVEIMAALETYGSAAREIIPDLKQLIVDYTELRKDWIFPETSFSAVEHAIKVIEAAKDHPPLLSAGSTPTIAKEPGK
jgi:HEAT repeat protein